MKSGLMNPRNIALLLTVATIGVLGWHNARRLEEVREKRRIMREQAVKLGIGSGEDAALAHKSKIREPEAPAPVEKLISADDVAFLLIMEEVGKNKAQPPADAKERRTKIFELPSTLSPAQLRKYMAEVSSLDQLSEDSRRFLLELAVKAMAEKSPAEGLDMAMEMDEKSPHPQGFPRFDGLLGRWAAKDSGAALAWVRANVEEHGDFINDGARCSLIKAIATTDRKLAFRLVNELEIETPSDATQGIVASARTPEERIAALADLREYLPTIENKSARNRAGDYAIALMGRDLAKSGFQAATAWADSADLTEAELVSFGSDIGPAINDGEQGKWIEWYGAKLPSGKFQKAVRQVMIYWSDDDYQAAGNWLASAPAGEVKNCAIMVYADSVSSHEPEAAVQWAITLPEGKGRKDTLHKIYHNWPKKDEAGKAAAAAFEKEYQIEHDH